MGIATVKKGAYFKKALIKSSVVVGVAFSSTSFISTYSPKPLKAKAEAPSISASEQTVNIIKKTSSAYTKPKSAVRLYVFGNVPKGAKIEVENEAKNYDEDFKHAIAAMDLDGIESVPAKSSRTIIVGSINKTKGELIEPDEDDFSFVADIDTF